MITAVDTNILLDVLIPDAPFGAASQQSLDTALQQGTLVLNEVVYAELAAHFPTLAELERFLADTGMRLIPPSQPPSRVLGEPGLPIPASAGQGFSALCAVECCSSPVRSVGRHSVAGNIW